MASSVTDPTRPVRRFKRVEVMREVAICPARGCGKEFDAKRSDQVFCSNACRQIAHRDRHDHQRVEFHEERNG